ncbi:MAG: Yip1 family protein [Sulfuricellaceae bacterium]|jgi:hypothetical protein|nr:Yip1 family protein [Sulfuricellaceae bacterium]
MNLVERVKKILLEPKSEWEVIAGESTSVADLYRDYVALLAAIGPLASIIGLSMVGINLGFGGTFRVPLGSALAQAFTSYILSMIGIFVVSLVIDALAPQFGGQKNPLQAFKVAAYASTPSWIAGIVLLVPMLGVVSMVAALYGLYLLYLGLPILMKVPQEKAVVFTIVVVVVAMVAMMLIGHVSSLFVTMPVMDVSHMR